LTGPFRAAIIPAWSASLLARAPRGASLRLQLRHAPLLLALGCAGAAPRHELDGDALGDLRAQLSAQSALVAQQQRRIEELEIRFTALGARTQPAPVKTEPAAPVAPRPVLKTIQLGEGKGRRLRRERPNPVERAPRLPSSLELKEPDQAVLESLAEPTQPTVDQHVAEAASADFEWAAAVHKLNDGDHSAAEVDLLAFAAAHPRHTAADNALYLAGLARESRGDCRGALELFESVPRRYPAGDAVPQALLEKGRCLSTLGKADEARAALSALGKEHPDAPEAGVARQLLHDL
jgi:TolA-binding protein